MACGPACSRPWHWCGGWRGRRRGCRGFDLLSQSLADHTLALVRHLAGAVPGTSLAAMRLYRLADMTAEACSPVSGVAGEPEG